LFFFQSSIGVDPQMLYYHKNIKYINFYDKLSIQVFKIQPSHDIITYDSEINHVKEKIKKRKYLFQNRLTNWKL